MSNLIWLVYWDSGESRAPAKFQASTRKFLDTRKTLRYPCEHWGFREGVLFPVLSRRVFTVQRHYRRDGSENAVAASSLLPKPRTKVSAKQDCGRSRVEFHGNMYRLRVRLCTLSETFNNPSLITDSDFDTFTLCRNLNLNFCHVII